MYVSKYNFFSVEKHAYMYLYMQKLIYKQIYTRESIGDVLRSWAYELGEARELNIKWFAWK